MPRKGSKKKAPAEKPDDEDWARMYGQPAEPRTVESYEEEWSHWNVQPEEPEVVSEPEPPAPSAPPSESEEVYFDSPVRLRKKRQVRTSVSVAILISVPIFCPTQGSDFSNQLLISMARIPVLGTLQSPSASRFLRMHSKARDEFLYDPRKASSNFLQI